MKCSIQSSLSGVFSLSLPLMNKAHFIHPRVHLALFLLRKISLGLAAIYLHFNNTTGAEKRRKSQDFSIRHLAPFKKAENLQMHRVYQFDVAGAN